MPRTWNDQRSERSRHDAPTWRPGHDRQATPPSGPLRGLAYLAAIVVATLAGTAFFIGGLLAGAEGFAGLALAAGFPLGGLLFALTLSVLQR